MIASLPMYDWPETRAYLDLFWKKVTMGIKPVCESIPTRLTRSDIHAQWQRDDLLLSQTCIYPLVTQLPPSTIVVGTPTYDVDLCRNGQYASVLLVGQSDTRNNLSSFKGSTLAYNSRDSQSGFNSLKSLLADEQLLNEQNPVFFFHTIQTGSHRASIDAVASGAAHICAIDPVSWALAQRYDNNIKRVRVLQTTSYSPALPLITSCAAIPAPFDESQWRNCIMTAYEQAIDTTSKTQLLLNGITFIPKEEYLKLPMSHFAMIED